MNQRFTIHIVSEDGASFEVPAGEPLLDSLLAQGVDLPYGCRYGGCITCAALPHKQHSHGDDGK